MIYVLEGDTPWGSEFSLRAVLDKYIYIYGFMLIPCFDGYVQSSLFLAVLVSNIIVSTALEYVIKLPLPNLATFVISCFFKSASNKEITHLLLREIQCQLFWSTTVCLCNVQSLLITILILWLARPSIFGGETSRVFLHIPCSLLNPFCSWISCNHPASDGCLVEHPVFTLQFF